VSDEVLLGRFGALVKEDRRVSAELLRTVDAIDRRQLWAKLGYSSLFDFCVRRFHMSEAVAGKRIASARAARRFPVIFEMVARGQLHLSGVQRLAAHLNPDNHERVLATAKHRSTREIEKLGAELAPKPDVASSLRKLLVRSGAAASPEPSAGPERPEVLREPLAAPPEPPAPPRAPDPAPLAPGRYKLAVTLDQQAHDQLRQLQDLLAHQIPSGDPAAIIKRALEALLTETQKKKTAATQKPRTPSMPRGTSSRTSRAVPADLKRAVWQRDQGRCGFISKDGHRCGATRALEYAHLHPWAKGGEHTLDNLGLRCRAHNAYEANRDYGERFMHSKRHEGGRGLRVREAARAVWRVAALSNRACAIRSERWVAACRSGYAASARPPPKSV
jgi:5-methylcytosine-specific restriction endonuclease McrA